MLLKRKSRLQINSKEILRRTFYITILIVVHFTLLRYLRTELFQLIVIDFLSENSLAPSLQLEKIHTRLYTILYSGELGDKLISFKVPFGFFFILSGFILLVLGRLKLFIYLVVIHGAVLIITFTLVQPGLTSQPFLLLIIDFLSSYMIPLASLALPAVSFFPNSWFITQNEHQSES